MAEKYPVPSFSDFTRLQLGTTVGGSIGYGPEVQIKGLLNAETFEESTGVVLGSYRDRVIISDGRYELRNHYMHENNEMKGFFGNVYSCKDNRSGFKFVIKYVGLEKRKIAEGKVKKSVIREVTALLECQHENIVKLIGLIVEQSCIRIILEHGGDPILSKISLKTVDEDILLTWFKNLLSGISYMHAKGFVHCDLHFGNILINHQNVLQICDLGSAKHVDEKLFTISHGYTVYYFPPTIIKLYLERKEQKQLDDNTLEQQQQILEKLQRTVKPRLDLYASGKLFLEIVSGRERNPIGLEELKTAIKSEKNWDHFLKKTIPKVCNNIIEDLITKLMTYTTADGFLTAENALEYIKIQKQMQKKEHTHMVMPLPPGTVASTERRHSYEEEPMDTTE